MEIYEIVILASIIVIVLLIGFLIYRTFKKAPIKEEVIKDASLIRDLFGPNNIVSVEQTQKRIRVEVKDLSLVDLEGLKPLTNGIFTVGNRVVATFKGKTEQIVKILEGK